MSLIVCPHCQEQISDSARFCVHCGKPFTICPECNMPIDSNLEQCPKCGFILKKDVLTSETPLKKEKEEESTHKRVNEAINNWKKRTLYTKLLPLGTVFGVIVFLFSFFYLIIKDSAIQNFSSESIDIIASDFFIMGCIGCAIIAVLPIFSQALQLLSYSSFKKYSKSLNIDLYEGFQLMDSAHMFTSKDTIIKLTTYDIVKTTAYCIADPASYNRMTLFTCLSNFFSLIGSLFFLKLFYDFIEVIAIAFKDYISLAKIGGFNNDLLNEVLTAYLEGFVKTDDVIILIVLCIALWIASVIFTVQCSNFFKNRDKWFNEKKTENEN